MPAFALETDRLVLRSPTLDDAPEMHEVFSCPVTMRHMPMPLSPSIDAMGERLAGLIEMEATHGSTLWSVHHKAGRRIIGCCGVFPFDRKGPEVEIGFCLGKDWWSQGLAYEASAAARDWAFSPKGANLDRLLAITHPDNEASHKLLRRLGMTRSADVVRKGRAQAMFQMERIR